MNIQRLEEEIINAHEADDCYKLVELYAMGADLKNDKGLLEEAAFLRTQAFVFALESAHPLVDELRCILAAEGREIAE